MKSLVDPGSVARTSRRSPEPISLIASAVFTIGSGQERPRASTTFATGVVTVIGWVPSNASDEDDLAVAGGVPEGGDALHPVDERVEVGLGDVQEIHREGASLDIDSPKLPGL